jgi:inorganic pyrophosphatase
MTLDRIPTWATDGFHVVVESPRGSTVKLKFDPDLGAIVWGRPLILGLSYPFDWGFIPGTRAADGDPLDAMILWEGATFPGIVVPCRAIAAVKVEQDSADHSRRVRNDRIVAAPLNARRSPDVISQRVRDELAAFFLHATEFEEKHAVVLGWDGADEAASLIRASCRHP